MTEVSFILLFWTFGEFKSQGESLFACFLTCVILRFTSGATPADCIEVSMAAERFQSTYLQTCLQVLVEVWAGARTQYCLCCEHSTEYHSATPSRLYVNFSCFIAATCTSEWDSVDVVAKTTGSGCPSIGVNTNATEVSNLDECKAWACQQNVNVIHW